MFDSVFDISHSNALIIMQISMCIQNFNKSISVIHPEYLKAVDKKEMIKKNYGEIRQTKKIDKQYRYR